MIDNKVRYEIDGSGTLVNQTMGSVRALTDYTTMIELVSPLPLDTSIMVNFLVYDSRNIDLPLFMIPNGKKGWQVSNNPLVADWNVWEVGIDQKALAAISKYRAGRIGVSFTFRERRPSKNALNYKGIFDDFNPLPLVGENDGDYYVCRGYNIAVDGVLYTYNDNAVWQVDKWVRDKNMRVILTTTTIDLPVDPALLANVPDVPEQDIADLIAQWGGGFVDMNTHINDSDIHVSPIDRDRWDGMLPRDGSELMEGHLNMAGYDIYDVGYLSVATTETHEIYSYHDAIKVLKSLDLTNKDLINIARVLANYVEALSVKTDLITSDSAQIGVNKDLDLSTKRLLRVAKGSGIQDGANMENIADQLPRDGSRSMLGDLKLNSHKILGLALGIQASDGANIQNIINYIFQHNISIDSHPDIRAEINALKGAFVYRGKILLDTEDVTPQALNDRIIELMDRNPIMGDVLVDNDFHEWYFNGTLWNDYGQGQIALASALTDGLMSKEHYTKLESLRTNEQNDDRYVEEALNDGKTYARKNKSWVEFQKGFLPDEETITLNNDDELEATNVAIWRYE